MTTIEWVWNKKGFAFPKTETKSTVIKKIKVNEKTKHRKR